MIIKHGSLYSHLKPLPMIEISLCGILFHNTELLLIVNKLGKVCSAVVIMLAELVFNGVFKCKKYDDSGVNNP